MRIAVAANEHLPEIVKAELTAPLATVASSEAGDSPHGVSWVTVNQTGSAPVGDGTTVGAASAGNEEGGSAACSLNAIKTSPTRLHCGIYVSSYQKKWRMLPCQVEHPPTVGSAGPTMPEWYYTSDTSTSIGNEEIVPPPVTTKFTAVIATSVLNSPVMST